jgi:threonine dehydratase
VSSVVPVSQEPVTFDDVGRAADRVRVLARATPVYTSRLFDEAAGLKAYFKCENFQRGGSFKIRGATNFIASLGNEQRSRGVVTYSSGNHAQAVAIAASHFNVRATIVMPADAPRAKVESTRAYSPQIVFFDRHRESREDIARGIAQDTGAVVLPPYDHPWIIAGQATAALELLRDLPDLDALAVPLGGGGLLSGSILAGKALRPGIRIFGVEPELANDWYLSLRRGERVRIDPSKTIADGLRTPIPGDITFPIVQCGVEDVLLVSEGEIQAAVRFLLTRMKILSEPSGAVAAAAAMTKKLPSEIRSLGVILSGGNIDLDLLASVCSPTPQENA